MRHILRCQACGAYTMQSRCPSCGQKALSPKPPKYSTDDKYADLRRQAKRELVAQGAL